MALTGFHYSHSRTVSVRPWYVKEESVPIPVDVTSVRKQSRVSHILNVTVELSNKTSILFNTVQAGRHRGKIVPSTANSRDNASFSELRLWWARDKLTRMSSDRHKEFVQKPGGMDVLLGRGGLANAHNGNRSFRELVLTFKPKYFMARKVDKPMIVQTILEHWKTRGGRWLARVEDTPQEGSSEPVWYVVDDVLARKKTAQCLREKTPEIMPLVNNIKKHRAFSLPLVSRSSKTAQLNHARSPSPSPLNHHHPSLQPYIAKSPIHRRLSMPLVSSSEHSNSSRSSCSSVLMDRSQQLFQHYRFPKQAADNPSPLTESSQRCMYSHNMNPENCTHMYVQPTLETDVQKHHHAVLEDYRRQLIYYRRKLDALEQMIGIHPRAPFSQTKPSNHGPLASHPFSGNTRYMANEPESYHQSLYWNHENMDTETLNIATPEPISKRDSPKKSPKRPIVDTDSVPLSIRNETSYRTQEERPAPPKRHGSSDTCKSLDESVFSEMSDNLFHLLSLKESIRDRRHARSTRRDSDSSNGISSLWEDPADGYTEFKHVNTLTYDWNPMDAFNDSMSSEDFMI